MKNKKTRRTYVNVNVETGLKRKGAFNENE